MPRAEWHLRVSSPAEAIRAIDANTGGALRRYLGGPGAKRYYKIALARKDNLLGLEELQQPTGKGDIYILPTVAGAKSAGAKILIGAALLALAIINPGAAFVAAKGGLTVLGLATVSIGASLVLGGITQLLTPTPSFDQNSVGDGRGSNIFGGNAASISQGSSVGLVYGRALVTPMPISLSYTAVDQVIVNSIAPQGYTIVYGEGGIINYVPIEPDPTANLPEN